MNTNVILNHLLFCSDLSLGQTQDDSIVGLRQNKLALPTMPVSGNLSSSNPDLAQGQQRIVDYSTQPPGIRTQYDH